MGRFTETRTDFLDRLARLDSTVVSDALDECGLSPGTLGHYAPRAARPASRGQQGRCSSNRTSAVSRVLHIASDAIAVAGAR